MKIQFEELWNELNRELRQYILNKVGQSQDAEDILQEVFIKIYKNLDGINNPKAINSWVYRITKNTIIDFYKKKKELTVLPESLELMIEEVEEEDNMNGQLTKCLEKMFFDIPEKYKTVYEMYEKRNMKHKEIMNELGISLSASKVRLKRARDMFKSKLLECCDFDTDRYGNIIEYRRKKDGCSRCCGNKPDEN